MEEGRQDRHVHRCEMFTKQCVRDRQTDRQRSGQRETDRGGGGHWSFP